MKINRFLRVALVILMMTALLVPAAARFGPYHFRFSLGTVGTQLMPLEPSIVATGGFDIVHASTHMFYIRPGITGISHFNSVQRTMRIDREGWYAFAIRGGDGGVGRSSVYHAFGGAGGMVMGYVWLAYGTTLYINIGMAGRGWLGTQRTIRPAGGGGPNGGGGATDRRGGQGGGATILSTVSNPTTQNANIIAVAGGGGGGGGGTQNNASVTSTGGHAGGARDNTANTVVNPPLNGFDSTQAGGVVLWPDNDNPTGLVSPGVRAGARTNTTVAIKTTSSAGTWSAANYAGGGGGATTGGTSRVTLVTPDIRAGNVFLGGNGANDISGGGGSGWWGGGGGGNSDQNGGWRGGGGGGGSSFVRSDVRPLTPEMLASGYFHSFWNLNNQTDGNGVPRYGTSLSANNLRHISNEYIGVSPPTATLGTYNTPTGILMQMRGSDAITDLGGPHDNGWNGFALIKYLGPADPADWTLGNTYQTWFAPRTPASANETTPAAGLWRTDLWNLINPLTPWTVGNHTVASPLYVNLYLPGGSWQRYVIANVTSLEREANGNIIIWGSVHHPWSTNLTGETFTALRVGNNGSSLYRRTTGGAWQNAPNALSGHVTVIGHGP